VYILRSKKDSNRIYVGLTNNLKRRLAEHTVAQGKSYTVRFSPWELTAYIAFRKREIAEKFELYLKSHSGRIFLKRRLF
jgi:predicted GIY-YIG superfamily endonuclease